MHRSRTPPPPFMLKAVLLVLSWATQPWRVQMAARLKASEVVMEVASQSRRTAPGAVMRKAALMPLVAVALQRRMRAAALAWTAVTWVLAPVLVKLKLVTVQP